MICNNCHKDFTTLHTYKGLCDKCAGIKPLYISPSKQKQIGKVLSNTLERIKPSPTERTIDLLKIAFFCHRLQMAVGREATITLGGSMGKGTDLR